MHLNRLRSIWLGTKFPVLESMESLACTIAPWRQPVGSRQRSSLQAPGDDIPCISNAGLAKFKFRRGKKHRLGIITAGASALHIFSIDGHTLTVNANDFVPVVPYKTQCKCGAYHSCGGIRCAEGA